MLEQQSFVMGRAPTGISLMGNFSVDYVGIAAAYLPDFSKVLQAAQSPDAEAVFVEMAGSADLEKSLYGLAGLRLIRSCLYQQHRDRIAKRSDRVYVGPAGCMFKQMSAPEAIAYLEQAESLKSLDAEF